MTTISSMTISQLHDAIRDISRREARFTSVGTEQANGQRVAQYSAERQPFMDELLRRDSLPQCHWCDGTGIDEGRACGCCQGTGVEPASDSDAPTLSLDERVSSGQQPVYQHTERTRESAMCKRAVLCSCLAHQHAHCLNCGMPLSAGL